MMKKRPERWPIAHERHHPKNRHGHSREALAWVKKNVEHINVEYVAREDCQAYRNEDALQSTVGRKRSEARIVCARTE